MSQIGTKKRQTSKSCKNADRKKFDKSYANRNTSIPTRWARPSKSRVTISSVSRVGLRSSSLIESLNYSSRTDKISSSLHLPGACLFKVKQSLLGANTYGRGAAHQLPATYQKSSQKNKKSALVYTCLSMKIRIRFHTFVRSVRLIPVEIPDFRTKLTVPLTPGNSRRSYQAYPAHPLTNSRLSY